MILVKQPEMLKLYGIDPNELKAQLKASEVKVKQVENDYDTVMKPAFTLLWDKWVV